MNFPPELTEQYEYLGELGRGGFGVVFRARQRRLDRLVAIKVMFADIESDPTMRDRFLEEGRLSAKVRHPNVVTVLETGTTNEGGLYIVYEFLEGRNLEDILVEDRRMGLSEAVKLTVGVLRGLAEIHAAGILHRDIKSANVVVLPDGRPKILDFGIARDVLCERRRTRTGEVVGTPEYLAPEIIQGQPASAASDLYSVGILLYQIATGRHPFPTDVLVALLHAHVKTVPADPSTLAPELSLPLCQLIMSAVSKDPASRPASAAAFADALQEIPLTRPRTTRKEGYVKVAPPGRNTARISASAADLAARSRVTAQRLTPPPKGSRRSIGIVVAIAAVMGAAVGYRAFTARPGPTEPSPTVDVPVGERKLAVSVQELVPEPGRLRVLLRSEPADLVSTHSVVVTTPLTYPLDLTARIVGLTTRFVGVSPAIIRAPEVIDALQKKLRSLPKALENAPGFDELNGLHRHRKKEKLPDAKVLENIERDLRQVSLAEPWYTLRDHAGPLLAADLTLADRDRLMALMQPLEDLGTRFAAFRLPVPVRLETVLPKNWEAWSTKQLPAGTCRRVALKALKEVKGADIQPAFMSRGVKSGESTPFLVPSRLISGKGVPDMGTPFSVALALGGEFDMPAKIAPKTGWIALALTPSSKTSLRVRMNDAITLRLFPHSTDMGHFAMVHRFPTSILKPGRNSLTIEAVCTFDEIARLDGVKVMAVFVGLEDGPGVPINLEQILDEFHSMPGSRR